MTLNSEGIDGRRPTLIVPRVQQAYLLYHIGARSAFHNTDQHIRHGWAIRGSMGSWLWDSVLWVRESCQALVC